MYVLPGKYYVSLSQYVRGEVTELVAPVEFTAKVLNNTTIPAEDREELVAFQNKLAEMSRAIRGTEEFAENLMERIRYDKQAVQRTPGASLELMTKVEAVEGQLDEILWKFNGQRPKASREENWPAPPSINERLNAIIWTHWSSTSAVSQSQKDVYEILKEEFPALLAALKRIHEEVMPGIEKELEEIGAPWTPGRIPEWNIE